MPGDTLLQINGKAVEDLIDYEYSTADTQLIMLFETPDGDQYEAEIEKDPEEELGIAFTDDGLGKKIVCRNKCLFCFVDQMPKHMRKTLYFKDDDWRLSFLMGGYITLTNLSEEEVERIICQKISPLYISVHASDNAIRARLLGNREAEKTFNLVKRFADNGILMHTQIVMCQGINDGSVLNQTVEELYALSPNVLSVAVVPVGLTKYREHLFPLSPISAQNARGVLREIHRLQRRFLKEGGSRFVFAADELYLKAGAAFPTAAAYEAFPQIENGVGLVAKFLDEVETAVREYCAAACGCARFAIVTGESFAPLMRQTAARLHEAFGAEIGVYPVKNHFFGETVTVTGLLTGQDVIAQLKGRLQEDVLLICSVCFKEGCNVMLDGVSIDEIAAALGVECRKVDPDGYSLVGQTIEMGTVQKTRNDRFGNEE